MRSSRKKRPGAWIGIVLASSFLLVGAMKMSAYAEPAESTETAEITESSTGAGLSDMDFGMGDGQIDGYTVVLIAGGILFSYPVTAKLLKCTGSLRDRYEAVWEVLKYLGVLVLLFLCVCSLAGAAYNPFIYFRF